MMQTLQIRMSPFGLRHIGVILMTAILGGLMFSFALSAPPPGHLVLEDEASFDEYLQPHVLALIDQQINPQAALDIDDVISRPDDFSPVRSRHTDFGLMDGQVWLWTRVQSGADKLHVWRIDINRQYYQTLDIYVRREGRPPVAIFKHEREDDFTMREVQDRLLGVDIALDPGETLDIYFAYRSTTTTYFPAWIGSIEAVTRRHAKSDLIDWTINGALLSFIIFALVMMPLIGARLSLSFALYILAGMLYVLHADGYTFAHVWPSHMSWNEPLNLSLMLLMPTAGLSFSRALFDFRTTAPRFDKLLIGFVMVSGLLAVSAFAIYDIASLQVAAYSLVPIGALLQVSAGLLARRKGQLGATPYLMGAFMVLASLVYATVAHVIPGRFDLDHTLDFGHVALLSESLVFSIAIGLRLIGLRRERDRAITSELAATQAQLDLSQKLQASRDDYIAARKLSDTRRKQLSSVSHDLQQPLASLRKAIGRIEGTDESTADQLYGTLDYLENLARKKMTAEQATPLMNRGRQSDTTAGVETFALSAVLDNVVAMFREDAEAKGLYLRYRPSDVRVSSDPVSLMRAINNLVTNAIRHTQKGGVLIGTRRKAGRIAIEVHDTGPGMIAVEIENALKRRSKGLLSDGEGLGLDIVQSLSVELGLDFEIESALGRGTTARLYLTPLDVDTARV